MNETLYHFDCGCTVKDSEVLRTYWHPELKRLMARAVCPMHPKTSRLVNKSVWCARHRVYYQVGKKTNNVRNCPQCIAEREERKAPEVKPAPKLRVLPRPVYADLKSELQNNPDFFTCETYGCVMKKTACVLRQKIEAKTQGRWSDYTGKNGGAVKCHNCDQGKGIMGSMDHEKIKPAKSWGYRGVGR